MAFGASGGRRAVLSTMANGPTFDPHGVDHQRVAFVIADGIPKPDRASEVLQELNCGAQHKKSPSLSFSLETNHHTLLSWFFCHTSPTEGPCYRTPAVPSRSAGVSLVVPPSRHSIPTEVFHSRDASSFSPVPPCRLGARVLPRPGPTHPRRPSGNARKRLARLRRSASCRGTTSMHA
jgi:hypothetical protein